MPSDLTSAVLHYLTHAPTSEFRQSEITLVDSWEGEENLLWRVNATYQADSGQAVSVDAVAKLFLDAGQARSRRQFDGMQFGHGLGIAPRPIWVDRYPEGLARQLLVYEWLEGDMEGDMIEPNDTLSLEALAASVAKLHKGDISAIRRFSPRPLNLDYFWRIEEGSIAQILSWLPDSLAIVAAYRQLVDTMTAEIDQRLPEFGQTLPTPIHGDLRLEHALSVRGQTLLLDWEQFGLGDPAQDCARFLHSTRNQLTSDHRQVWRTAYLSQSDQPQLAERLGLFERLLALNAVTYLLVGLEQHAAATTQAELTAAAPFLHDTLSTAWMQATDALGVTLASAPGDFLEPFFAWVTIQALDASST